MLHQHPNATTAALVSQDEQSCLHRLLQEKGLALRHAAYLLAGGRGDKLVDELARRLAAERVLSRTTQRRASDLLDILALEFVDDPERVDDSVPDTKKIHENLIRMQSILAQADNPGPRYLQALCWHGARLGDLAARVA